MAEVEDADQWIEKVTAIFDFSGTIMLVLPQQLPLILYVESVTWFTQLGQDTCSQRVTCYQWQQAIENALHMPNYKASLVK
jgi:hypothetical protein